MVEVHDCVASHFSFERKGDLAKQVSGAFGWMAGGRF